MIEDKANLYLDSYAQSVLRIMEKLTLAWSLQNHLHHYTFHQAATTKVAQKLRIGRDPAQCDIIFADRSVSSLHVELFFSAALDAALIQNLRPSNPPLIDGFQLTQGTANLSQGSQIQLGRIQLQVSQLVLPGQVQVAAPPQPQVPNTASAYGLKCPNPSCGKVSRYDEQVLKQGCPWCGFSLAAANTVMMVRPQS